VQLADGAQDVNPEEILATVRTQLADYKVPERLRFVKKIPRNTLGKIDRNVLVSMIQERKKAGAPDAPCAAHMMAVQRSKHTHLARVAITVVTSFSILNDNRSRHPNLAFAAIAALRFEK
jgi:hypothetical protein